MMNLNKKDKQSSLLQITKQSPSTKSKLFKHCTNFYIRKDKEISMHNELRFTRPIPERELRPQKIKLSIYNNSKKQLIDFMLIHSNSVGFKQFPRILYTKIFNEKNIQQEQWPFFKQPKGVVLYDIFQIRFSIKTGNSYRPWSTQKQIIINIDRYLGLDSKQLTKQLAIRIQNIDSNICVIIDRGSSTKIDEQRQVDFSHIIIESHVDKLQPNQQIQKIIQNNYPGYTFQSNLYYLAKYELERYKQIKQYQKQIKNVMPLEMRKKARNFIRAYIKQGSIGNCYLISSLDQIILKAEYLLDLIWVFISEQDDIGFCILNVDGIRFPVPVKLDLIKERIYGAKISHQTDNQRLAQLIRKAILIEAALIQVFGGQDDKVQRGVPEQPLMMLTNFDTKRFKVKKIKEYLSELQKWQKQFEIRLRQEDHKQNDLNYQGQSTKMEMKSEARLIVVSVFKFQSTKNHNIDQFVSNFCKLFGDHGLSFRGYKIQDHNMDDVLKHPNKCIIILADSRGRKVAGEWRRLWVKHYHKQLIFKSTQYKYYYYNAKNEQKYQYEENEVLLTLQQLSWLPSQICICNYRCTKIDKGYYQPYTFISWPLTLHKNKSKSYSIIGNGKFRFQTTLHHLNRRFHLDMIIYSDFHPEGKIQKFGDNLNNNLSITRLIYPELIFELKKIDKGKCYYQYFCQDLLEPQKHFFSFQNTYDFLNNQYEISAAAYPDYSSAFMKRQSDKPNFLYISTVSESNHIKIQYLQEIPYVFRIFKLQEKITMNISHPVASCFAELIKSIYLSDYDPQQIEIRVHCKVESSSKNKMLIKEPSSLLTVVFHRSMIEDIEPPKNEYFSSYMQQCWVQQQQCKSIPTQTQFQMTKTVTFMSSDMFLMRFELNIAHQLIKNLEKMEQSFELHMIVGVQYKSDNKYVDENPLSNLTT